MYLSNGGTEVFLDVLALAACDLAASEWEVRFALLCCNSRIGGGNDGFDLDELPWGEAEWPVQREFLLRVVDTALGRHRWEVLGYDPPAALGYLRRYREVVRGYVPAPPLSSVVGWWEYERDEAHLRRCGRHGLFVGVFEDCRLCAG
ncbi:hypothetical protein [Allokutzneria sp. NRRL B-24872]|uniref:hypothetical protein n=1 Tax=Allokutzneria sp. NRRL B-24872 TaxID=1137961 RepID=UPI000A3A9DAE|nr:hypothetical protein [Allokutzneria sp. NRRL B-24872]